MDPSLIVFVGMIIVERFDNIRGGDFLGSGRKIGRIFCHEAIHPFSTR